MHAMLATLVLSVHLLVIAFNLFGMVAVPLGAWRGWQFVHAPAWRLLHVASLGITALQAAVGDACFLTRWEVELSGAGTSPEPMVMHWINAMIYWQAPAWVFLVAYLLAVAYVLALLWLVPLRRR